VAASVVPGQERSTDNLATLEAERGAAPAEQRREPRAAFLLLAFTSIAAVLTVPNVTRLRTFVDGDSGDSLLVLWVLRSVQRGVPHGWDAMWNAPIFSPTHGTLAYSDTLFPVAMVHWPLRLLVGDVLAFNLIALGAWVLSSWCMYRLCMRMTAHWIAAFVGALAYTYAAVRLTHFGHFQLVVGGALVPLVVLLLLRCLDAPSVGRGLALGGALAALTLTASYYGAMLGVVTAIVVLGFLAIVRPAPMRSYLQSLGIAALVAVILVLPFALEYVSLQRDPAFRRDFDPAVAAHPDDFLSTGQNTYLLDHVPVISPRSEATSGTIENRLFPGVVALTFGIAGVVVIACDATRDGWRSRRVREAALLAGGGLVCVLLAFGDRVTFAGHELTLPFALLRDHVPGFAGIRATARLALGGQLVVAVFAAIGLEAALRGMRRRSARLIVGLALAGFVVLEAAMPLTSVRVPTRRDDGGVAIALADRAPGTVVELPIRSSANGVEWPYVEAPRQLMALDRDHPRVNGYSGFQPKGFDEQAAGLSGFPNPTSMYELRRAGVRYVVLRTRLVGELSPSVLQPALAADGVGRYDDATARAIIGALPSSSVRDVDKLPGGYLIELAEAR
jgi:hypothetical protein